MLWISSLSTISIATQCPFKTAGLTINTVNSSLKYSTKSREYLIGKLRTSTSNAKITQIKERLKNKSTKYRTEQELCANVSRDISPRLRNILLQDVLVVCRQYEMLNIFFGYEQHNRYVIHDRTGQPVGYILEESGGIMRWFARQLLRTHRPLKAWILDMSGEPLLAFHRPWRLINSRLSVMYPSINDQSSIIGEVHQEWHLFNRRYDLFIDRKQFAKIDAPFLSWDFNLMDENDQQLCIISRNFTHFVREMFTDTGQYLISFGRTHENEYSLLCKRAIMLGCAISIDVDYFSRHSNHHHGII